MILGVLLGSMVTLILLGGVAWLEYKYHWLKVHEEIYCMGTVIQKTMRPTKSRASYSTLTGPSNVPQIEIRIIFSTPWGRIDTRHIEDSSRWRSWDHYVNGAKFQLPVKITTYRPRLNLGLEIKRVKLLSHKPIKNIMDRGYRLS